MMRILWPDTEIFASDEDRREALFFVHEFLARTTLAGGHPKPQNIAIEPLAGGRNAVHVLKVTPLPAVETKVPYREPFVIKIVSCDKGRQEKAAYDKFVRAGVPPCYRPELFDFIDAGKYSALCYAYVGGSRAEINTISSRLQKQDPRIIKIIIGDIFSKIGNTWYGKTAIRREQAISDYYAERYFPDRDHLIENIAMLSHLAASYFGLSAGNGVCTRGGRSIAPLLETLFQAGRSHRYSSCILHGDFNTDNIIVGSDEASTILIDFQKTGRGHVYMDLVALESSIRINFPGDAAFDHIWRQEQRVASGLQPISQDAYVAAIQAIRIAAFNHFGAFEDDWTYHFAVVATSLRLMQATDLSDAAKARITAAALWAANILKASAAQCIRDPQRSRLYYQESDRDFGVVRTDTRPFERRSTLITASHDE